MVEAALAANQLLLDVGAPAEVEDDDEVTRFSPVERRVERLAFRNEITNLILARTACEQFVANDREYLAFRARLGS